MNTTTLNVAFHDDSYDASQSKIKKFIVNIFTAVKSWNENAKGRRAIAKLNDHYLRDAGLTRVETATFASSLFLTDPISQYVHRR